MSHLHTDCQGECGQSHERTIPCAACGDAYCEKCAPDLLTECKGCGEKVCKECMQDNGYCIECRSSEAIERQASITAQTGSRHDMSKLAKLESHRLERKEAV